MAIEQLPPVWTNQDVVLFHGTTVEAAREIVAGRIDLRYAGRRKDFGPGFYTTTIERQARIWGTRIARWHLKQGRSSKAAVVRLAVKREELTLLQFLAFVDGGFDAEDFWSLIRHCRSGAVNHARTIPGASATGYYDVVFGPVSHSWELRRTLRNADQISFHTKAAIHVLNTKAVRSIIGV